MLDAFSVKLFELGKFVPTQLPHLSVRLHVKVFAWM